MHESRAVERTWDLTDIYPDAEAWDRDRRDFLEGIARLPSHRGELGRSASQLASVLERLYELERQGHRLHTYASLLADADLREPRPQGMRQEIESAYAEFAAQSAFIDPEILDVPLETLRAFVASEPRLAPFDRALERLEARRAHTLSHAEEAILGQSRLLRGSGETISTLLRNAELPWPEISLHDGTRLRVDSTGYNRVRLSPHRGDRKAGFAAFHGALQAFKSTLAASVHATLKEHVFEARARRYGSCLEAALHGNEVDPAVYAMLIREVNAALPLIHRYLRLRARVLRIPDLAYHDLYAPLAPEPAGRYAWDQARELVTSALAPLGPDYVEQLTRALQSRWVDVDPRAGKRSGAFVNDGAYDAHPYMLLNHQDDYHSASTLAHEAGHLMHSTYSQRHQPYPTARYVIFVAEVASTFNEILLHRYLLDRAEDDERRLALLGHYLDNIRGTVFRQTMFAEFELEIHARAERGEALTGEELGAIYFELLQRYHGTADGVLAIDPLYAAEWGFVPHFHYNFYVYQYATSYVAATALARRILSGSTSATIRYLDFLSRGSARPPVELLRDAGVDMTSSEPIQATMTEMSEVMDAMDAILARRG